LLVTGFDIIFFWVAPDDDDGAMPSWATCRSAPSTSMRLVRDGARPERLSKSKGQYHRSARADRQIRPATPLRFTLAALRGAGPRTVKLAGVAGRGLSQLRDPSCGAPRALCRDERLRTGRDVSIRRACRETINRWIVGETRRDRREGPRRAFEAFRFDEAANGLYQFIWGTFCDWYIEFTKPILTGPPGRGAGRDARHDPRG